MVLINNFEAQNNHLQILKSLLAESDSAIFVSPFLSPDPKIVLPFFERDKRFDFTLITTLIPYSNEQYEKAILFSCLEKCNGQNFNLRILIDKENTLHAKVYLFKKKGVLFAGIVSSANLTSNGMQNKHEWGVLIKEQSLLEELETKIMLRAYYDVSKTHITEMLKCIPQNIPVDKSNKENSSNFWEILNDEIKSMSQYWIKPIGYVEDPITEEDTMEKDDSALYFSKRPIGIRRNDYLIVYGVGTSRLLSIHQVVSDTIRETTEEDWKIYDWMRRSKYEIKTINLTPKFGSCWTKYNLFLRDLEEKFKKLTGTNAITNAGNSSAMGAIQLSQDKVKLTKEFGKYIYTLILEIENQLI